MILKYIYEINMFAGWQGVTFPAGLRVLPAGNLEISQEIQIKCPVVSSKIVSEGKKVLYVIKYPIIWGFRWHNV